MLTASYCLSTNPILRCWGGGEIWTRRLQKRMQSLPPFPPSPQLPLGFRSLRTRAFLARVNSLSPALPILDVTDRRGIARSLPPVKGWDFFFKIGIFLLHALAELAFNCFNRKQTRPFSMFEGHLFLYFGVGFFFLWKRFAMMRGYDNMFHGFCCKYKCFQQRLISFRSVLSESDNLFVSWWSLDKSTFSH